MPPLLAGRLPQAPSGAGAAGGRPAAAQCPGTEKAIKYQSVIAIVQRYHDNQFPYRLPQMRQEPDPEPVTHGIRCTAGELRERDSTAGPRQVRDPAPWPVR